MKLNIMQGIGLGLAIANAIMAIAVGNMSAILGWTTAIILWFIIGIKK